MSLEPLIMNENGTGFLLSQWCKKFKTGHFVAKTTSKGVFIRPILDIEYHEDHGRIGLRLPGIEAGKFAEMIDVASKKIDREKARKQKTASQRRARALR